MSGRRGGARPRTVRRDGMCGTAVRWVRGVFPWLLWLLFPSGDAGAARFETHVLALEGQIRTAISDDLDGDGRQEMIVSVCVYEDHKPPRRLLRIYRLPQGREGENLSLVRAWEAPVDAVFWCTGPATQAAGKSVYVLSQDGLWELCNGPGGTVMPAHRIQAPLFLSTGQEDELLWLDVLRDWDGDGLVEALLPCAREARFYRPDGEGGWKIGDAVSIAPFAAYNNNVLFGRNAGGYQYLSVLFFPLLEPADLNGDGRMDLLVLQTGKAHCYFRREDGHLDPVGVVWNLDIRTPEERIRKQASLTFRVADLNRDGCADIVVHKIGVNFTDWSSETAIFLCNRGGSAPSEPFQRFTSGGLLSGVSIEDLDHDGFPDMTLWSIKMGLWPVVEILLRKAVTINSQYFYPSWPGGFPETPAQKLAHEFRIDMKKQHYFRGIVPNTSGDFNGDGIKDLAAGKDLDTLGIYLGVAKKGFESKLWATLNAEGVNYVTSGDLDGDDLCDLHAYSVEEGTSRVLVWLQRPE